MEHRGVYSTLNEVEDNIDVWIWEDTYNLAPNYHMLDVQQVLIPLRMRFGKPESGEVGRYDAVSTTFRETVYE